MWWRYEVMDLSLSEKKLLIALEPLDEASPRQLAAVLQSTEDAVIQHAHLLTERGLVDLDTAIQYHYELTREGETYVEKGLPERQLLATFDKTTTIQDLTSHPLAAIGIGWLRKKGWVTIREGIVTKRGDPPAGEDEEALITPGRGGDGVKQLIKRGLAVERTTTVYRISLTSTGRDVLSGGVEIRGEIGPLTRDIITSGTWREVRFRRYSVEKIPKRVVPGKTHPYQQLIDEMREILLDMGFTELAGGIVQSAFWNFDALFQPQDHPAREMQDTFYLNERLPLPAEYPKVQAMHEYGGGTSSTGWGRPWSVSKAEQCVLRTHTTLLSIQHLATHTEPPVKAFCIGRVYRREATDPTHTPEFEQLEGIVMDEGVNFGHLLGYLKAFYARMGFVNIRFRPAYFPYTEPSVEPEVYVDGLGWIELGGAGIFREEVTAPWGIKHPVLAWGLGVSRVAMLMLDLKDLRMLYRSDIDWIRRSPIFHCVNGTRSGV